MLDIKDEKNGVSFHVSVLPKSSKNMIMGEHAGALKVKLTAAPVDNAANKLCVTFLAKTLGVSKSSLEIISGHTARNKHLIVRCTGKDEMESVRNRLLALAVEK
jgi:uncharacterized protein (TIGR00251 family)